MPKLACDSRVATAQGPLLIFSAGAAAREQYGPYGPPRLLLRIYCRRKITSETAVQLCVQFFHTDGSHKYKSFKRLCVSQTEFIRSLRHIQTLLLGATKYKKSNTKDSMLTICSTISGSFCYYNHYCLTC